MIKNNNIRKIDKTSSIDSRNQQLNSDIDEKRKEACNGIREHYPETPLQDFFIQKLNENLSNIEASENKLKYLNDLCKPFCSLFSKSQSIVLKLRFPNMEYPIFLGNPNKHYNCFSNVGSGYYPKSYIESVQCPPFLNNLSEPPTDFEDQAQQLGTFAIIQGKIINKNIDNELIELKTSYEDYSRTPQPPNTLEVHFYQNASGGYSHASIQLKSGYPLHSHKDGGDMHIAAKPSEVDGGIYGSIKYVLRIKL